MIRLCNSKIPDWISKSYMIFKTDTLNNMMLFLLKLPYLFSFRSLFSNLFFLIPIYHLSVYPTYSSLFFSFLFLIFLTAWFGSNYCHDFDDKIVGKAYRVALLLLRQRCSKEMFLLKKLYREVLPTYPMTSCYCRCGCHIGLWQPNASFYFKIGTTFLSARVTFLDDLAIKVLVEPCIEV